ncbi:glycosyltransferase family 2 protein [Legionella lytica]|uniref:Glycosyltransferase family 2 protein n=1 Tax=Legionella lytica TaxID=96232 RepID=A0ABW8DD39_9GAMM
MRNIKILRFFYHLGRGNWSDINRGIKHLFKKIVLHYSVSENNNSWLHKLLSKLFILIKISPQRNKNSLAISSIVALREGYISKITDSIPLKIINNEPLPDIDISVVTYNSSRWVSSFINSLLTLTYPPKKISLYFVDNNSTDDTVKQLLSAFEKLRFYGFSVKLIRSLNKGYGFGHNIGVSAGKSPYCLITNIDLVFAPDALFHVVSQACIDDLLTVTWELRQKPYEHPKYYDPVTGYTNWNSHACILMRRSAFELIGGYDENIFMYGEDVELSYRFRRAGFMLRYCPKAVVTHYCYEDIDVIKPLQYTGSTFANLYIRLKYGTVTDLLAIPWMSLKLIAAPKLFPSVCKQNLYNLLRLIKLLPSTLYHRRQSSALFPFRKWDYDISRYGAYYKVPEMRSQTPLVSIITRTYAGRDLFIKQAILSVANQTWPNIEHIIVQDGGDCMREMVENLSHRIHHKIVFVGSTKVGRSAAGNIGLKNATGRWCLFLDDDDLLFSEHIEVLATLLEDSMGARGAYSLAWEVVTKKISDDSTYGYEELSYRVSVAHYQPFDYEVLKKYNYMPIQSVLFERTLFCELGGFNEDMEILEDWLLWLKFSKNNPFIYVDKVTSMYRTPAEPELIAKRNMAFNHAYPLVVMQQKFISEV